MFHGLLFTSMILSTCHFRPPTEGIAKKDGFSRKKIHFLLIRTHDERLESLFEKLKEYNVTINLESVKLECVKSIAWVYGLTPMVFTRTPIA